MIRRQWKTRSDVYVRDPRKSSSQSQLSTITISDQRGRLRAGRKRRYRHRYWAQNVLVVAQKCLWLLARVRDKAVGNACPTSHATRGAGLHYLECPYCIPIRTQADARPPLVHGRRSHRRVVSRRRSRISRCFHTTDTLYFHSVVNVTSQTSLHYFDLSRASVNVLTRSESWFSNTNVMENNLGGGGYPKKCYPTG